MRIQKHPLEESLSKIVFQFYEIKVLDVEIN